LQGAEIPSVGGDVVEIVVGVICAGIVGDFGISLNVGDNELRCTCEGGIDAVDGFEPAVRVLFGDMASFDLCAVGFEVGFEPRKVVGID